MGYWRNFQDAFRGLVYTFRYELSFRIQSVIGIIALFMAFYLPLRLYEKVVIILLVAVVLILELINSVVERIMDLFKPRIDHAAKIIKDIMAGAVLVACLIAAILGTIIFLPYFVQFFNIAK